MDQGWAVLLHGQVAEVVGVEDPLTREGVTILVAILGGDHQWFVDPLRDLGLVPFSAHKCNQLEWTGVSTYVGPRAARLTSSKLG